MQKREKEKNNSLVGFYPVVFGYRVKDFNL